MARSSAIDFKGQANRLDGYSKESGEGASVAALEDLNMLFVEKVHPFFFVAATDDDVDSRSPST
jgi:hypothetical protein